MGMVNMNIRTNKLVFNKTRMAFIIGLFSANNIISLFSVGSTPMMLVWLFSLLFMSYIVINDKKAIHKAFRYVTFDLLLTIFFIVFSLFFVLLYNSSFLYQWFVGVLGIMLNISVLVIVLMLADHVDYILKGIFVGVLINFVFSIVGFIMYNRGIVFTLNNLFPAVTDISVPSIRSAFRAYGLFKEPGHLMRYITIMALPLWATSKAGMNSFHKLLILFLLMFFTVFSRSASVLVFVIGIGTFVYIVSRKSRRKLLSLFLLIPVLAMVFYWMLGAESVKLVESFLSGLLDVFKTKDNNTIRRLGMKNALEIIKMYPISGCGWNTFTQVLMKENFYDTGATGSFSVALSLVSELGLMSIPYFYFLIKKSFTLIKRKNYYSIALGCSLFMYFILFCITDYSIDSSVAVLLGLVLIENKNNRKTSLEAATKNEWRNNNAENSNN